MERRPSSMKFLLIFKMVLLHVIILHLTFNLKRMVDHEDLKCMFHDMGLEKWSHFNNSMSLCAFCCKIVVIFLEFLMSFYENVNRIFLIHNGKNTVHFHDFSLSFGMSVCKTFSANRDIPPMEKSSLENTWSPILMSKYKQLQYNTLSYDSNKTQFTRGSDLLEGYLDIGR